MDILGSKSSETASNLAEFMQTNNYTFPVLLDSKMSVTSNYGIQSTPTNFLIDRDGVIRYRQTGAFSSPQDFETKVNELLAK